MEYGYIIVKELAWIALLLIVLCMLHVERIKRAIWKWIRTFKNFFRQVLCGVLFYLLWLVPRRKNLIVFGADAGDRFDGNPKRLFLEAQKYTQVKAVWITKSAYIYKKVLECGYEVYLCNSLKGLWMQLRAGTVIHSNSIKEDFNYLVVGGATSVNCWHGVGLKRSWYRNKNSLSGKWMAAPPSLQRSYQLWWARTNMSRKNYVIGTSEEVNAYYPATYNVSSECVLNLGQARNDVFYDDSADASPLPFCFGTGKTILYMPTHRNYGKHKGKSEHIGKEIDFEKLSQVLDKYGYTFIIKQHRWNSESSILHRKYKNIVDISRPNFFDTQLILKYTDILITDYSSCYTDFLLLNRPVVFYCYDLDQYLSKWELNFDYDYVTPGPKVFTSDELIDALEMLMQGQDGYEAERQRVKCVFYSPENQGPVAKKQMDYIMENIVGK